MIKGIKIDFGGNELIVPPLSLGAIEDNIDRIGNYQSAISKESVAAVIDLTVLALRRNYPDITRERVREFIDVGNMEEVFQALMDVSGLKRKEQEAKETQALGESLGDASIPT